MKEEKLAPPMKVRTQGFASCIRRRDSGSIIVLLVWKLPEQNRLAGCLSNKPGVIKQDWIVDL
jgi:hypothetical protein